MVVVRTAVGGVGLVLALPDPHGPSHRRAVFLLLAILPAFQGRGVEPSDRTAARWYWEAAEGDAAGLDPAARAAARRALGVLHKLGRGIPQDDDEVRVDTPTDEQGGNEMRACCYTH